MEKKGFHITTRFSAILTEHQNNLFLKNYSEKMINSRSEAGLFFKQLHAAFRQAYVTNVEDYKLDQFQLEMTGYFGRKKDKVKFEFAYSYDPYNIRLNLTSLKATMNDEFEKIYPIKSHPSQDLPSSGKVHEELFAMRETELAAKVKEMLVIAPNRKKKTR